MSPSLILASASPRRAELLRQIGVPFTVVVADIDERPLDGEAPVAYVERLARAKASAGLAGLPTEHASAVVLGADTTVVIDDEILGKPSGQTEGVAMLRRLSGRMHTVLTAVAVGSSQRMVSQVVESDVYFREISEDEAISYWHTGEPQDKAGGYGIQGIGGVFAQRLEGSFSAVVGLPLATTDALLQAFNIDTWSMRIDGRRTPD